MTPEDLTSQGLGFMSDSGLSDFARVAELLLDLWKLPLWTQAGYFVGTKPRSIRLRGVLRYFWLTPLASLILKDVPSGDQCSYSVLYFTTQFQTKESQFNAHEPFLWRACCLWCQSYDLRRQSDAIICVSTRPTSNNSFLQLFPLTRKRSSFQ